MRARSALLAVAVLTSASIPLVSASEPLPTTPPGRVLVVNNNAQEAFGRADLDDSTDMYNLAGRISTLVTYAPDVVLLQEVVADSATTVAQAFTEAVGHRYEVLVSPDDSAVVRSSDRETVIRDTAILINADTMRALSAGGFIATTYSQEDSSDGSVRTKEHAHAAVAERDGSMTLPLLSLHYVTNPELVSDEVGWDYKAKWAHQVGSFLNHTYRASGRAHVPVVAGDFNNRRCTSPTETLACDTLPFWTTMTGELDHVDSILAAGEPGEIGTRKRIDYVFARGSVLDAASDLSYDDAEKADPATFYSDHRLIWTLVGEPERL